MRVKNEWSKRYCVRTRYGYGWEVRGPGGYQSITFHSQLEATNLAKHLNDQLFSQK